MRLVRVIGFAAAAAVSLSGGMASAVQDSHRCLVRVDRSQQPTTYALTRIDLVDGGCVCLVQTGPAQRQSPAIELQIKTLQGTGVCPEAIKVGPNAKKPQSMLLPLGMPGGGSVMGGLFAALVNGPAFLSTTLPDSPGG